jgi:putative nucleotidyltransferase with HDIG domain
MSEHHEALLIISDEQCVIRRLKDIAYREGYHCRIATRADQVCAALGRNDIALVLMDIQATKGSSFALLREIRKRYPSLPIITIAGISNIDAAVGSLQYGAYDYVTKPFFSEEVINTITRALEKRRLELTLGQLERSFDTELAEKSKQLSMAFMRAIAALSVTCETSNIYTQGHSRRVTGIAMAMGRKLGLDKEQLDDLRWGGLLHDIGKIAIDQHILNKPSKLTSEEYAHVMTHPLVGATLVDQVTNNVSLVEIIQHHHCFYNGHGFGQIIRRGDLPLLARILTVADAYDAMTSPRPYRPALSREKALAEITYGSGNQFDPILVDIFLGCSLSEVAPDSDGLLMARGEPSNRLLLKSILLNKHARTAWLKDLCMP